MGNQTSLEEQIFGGDSRQLPAALIQFIAAAGGAGGDIITGDEVAFHADGSQQMVFPQGMTFQRGIEILERLHRDSETEMSFERQYRYRPNDGAWATAQVIKARYGMQFGEGSFFRLPETRSFDIGFGQKVQVPWGRISIPALQGVEIMLCDRHGSRDYGKTFDLHVAAPKKFKDEIGAFFDDVETYLREHSIYRGQAVVGSDDLEYLDLAKFDPNQIVFSDEATNLLNDTVWTPLRFSQAMRDGGVPLKRAVLLHGPFGTGKTSAGWITAKIAVENGWTYISARPGVDDVEDVLRTAKLYAPAVVFVEDIDVQTDSGESDAVTKFLDAFDGITAKGAELIVVMTTNHIERIHKGMLRPGRIDGMIEISHLDRRGVERLIRAVVPVQMLDVNVDFEKVFETMEGFFPSFVREAVDRARIHAIGRTQGSGNFILTTEDLVSAAQTLRPQLDILDEASEGRRKPTIDGAFKDMVEQVMHGVKVVDPADGSYVEYQLSVPALNGQHS